MTAYTGPIEPGMLFASLDSPQSAGPEIRYADDEMVAFTWHGVIGACTRKEFVAWFVPVAQFPPLSGQLFGVHTRHGRLMFGPGVKISEMFGRSMAEALVASDPNNLQLVVFRPQVVEA